MRNHIFLLFVLAETVLSQRREPGCRVYTNITERDEPKCLVKDYQWESVADHVVNSLKNKGVKVATTSDKLQLAACAKRSGKCVQGPRFDTAKVELPRLRKFQPYSDLADQIKGRALGRRNKPLVDLQVGCATWFDQTKPKGQEPEVFLCAFSWTPKPDGKKKRKSKEEDRPKKAAKPKASPSSQEHSTGTQKHSPDGPAAKTPQIASKPDTLQGSESSQGNLNVKEGKQSHEPSLAGPSQGPSHEPEGAPRLPDEEPPETIQGEHPQGTKVDPKSQEEEEGKNA